MHRCDIDEGQNITAGSCRRVMDMPNKWQK
jgi:hypothetical protein